MAETIGICIESLLALDYPGDRYEIIIVDNGSMDGSRDIALKYPVKVLDEAKPGSYAARNRGIKESRGEYIAFTDADCRVTPAWLTNMVKAFRGHRTWCVAGRISPVHGNTVAERWQASNNILSNEKAVSERTYIKPYAMTANAMFPRFVFDKVGLFDESSPSTCDAEMGWRIYDMDMEVKYAPKAVVYHRHRINVKGVWKQFFRYGMGNAALFKRHRAGRKVRVDINDKLSLLKAVVKIFTYPWPRREDVGRWAPVLDAVRNAAFVSGKIVGSIRYRVLVI